MGQRTISDGTAKELREAWFRYLDTIEEIRPSLHRYCRRITRDLWDAEDLVQETLLKGFGAIGRGDSGGVRNTRAFLFRIATNLWIDQLRRSQNILREELENQSIQPERSLSAREASAALLSHPAPQERAAVLLKDVFDFSLEEIAEMLSTTVGAIKSALHRGRLGLDENRLSRGRSLRAPSKELLDQFVRAFNARDVRQVTELLLENATVNVPGMGEGGKPTTWVHSALELPTSNAPEREQTEMTAEVVRYGIELLVVIWTGPPSDRAIGSINRFEEQDGRIALVWEYYFCPETIAEVARELSAKPSNHGYRHTPEVSSNVIASAVLPWSK
jgi:RNA polymerase sigma-70 factor, ECF subfamily